MSKKLLTTWKPGSKERKKKGWGYATILSECTSQ
jgi:hypothetical protein